MLRVTTDLETTLYQLERQMLSLVKSRDEVIAQAEHMIRFANREFDELAVPLSRQINELRERLKKDEQLADTPTRKPRSHKPPALDGLDDDDQAHYQELLAKRRKKR